MGGAAASSATAIATTARTCWSSVRGPHRHPDAGASRAARTRCSSRTSATRSSSSRSSAKATLSVTDRFSLTGGLRYYHFSEDKEQVFDGIFANDNTGTSLVSQPGSTDANGVAPRFIATYKVTGPRERERPGLHGFRLGGINDPLNVPLCTPQDLVTFGGRDTWKDETAWNYEVGVKSRVLNGRARSACRRSTWTSTTCRRR